MSRVGNNPITIPDGVVVDIQTDQITIKGKLGELSQPYDTVTFTQEDTVLTVSRPSEAKPHKAKHGLYRALVNNMVEGVSKGFTKELELVGVGYRASNQGQKLDLALGFSHNIVFEVCPEVKVETETVKGSNPKIILKSYDKQLLGQVCAKIRSFRKHYPYKGKGIRLVGERVRRKAGKTTA